MLRRLVATADVLVENFRPGTLERWGLGPDVLHELNPGLVLVRITGFGQTGPYAARPGFGTLAEAMSGFAARSPARPTGRRRCRRSAWPTASAASRRRRPRSMALRAPRAHTADAVRSSTSASSSRS